MAALDDDAGRFLEAWMSVRQIVQAANFNRFRSAGLSATQFMTLNMVPAEGLTLSELARRLNLSPASVKHTVDSLEQRGLLRRAPHHVDRRKLLLVSTPSGDHLRNSASGEFHDFVSSLFAAMPATRREGLVRGLESLIQASEALAAQPAASRRGHSP